MPFAGARGSSQGSTGLVQASYLYISFEHDEEVEGRSDVVCRAAPLLVAVETVLVIQSRALSRKHMRCVEWLKSVARVPKAEQRHLLLSSLLASVVDFPQRNNQRIRAFLDCFRFLAMPIDHAGVIVSDLKSAKEKYEKALKPLGYKFFAEYEGKAVGFAYPCSFLFGLIKFDKPDFWLSKGTASTGVHLAFQATVEQCKQFYEAALAAGFKDNGPPGPRPQYHKNYFGAFVLDDDGNNIEAVCHRA